MRQVIYESVATDPPATDTAPAILRGARPFNGLNGVTGLLCAANDRFLQVLEGPEESVELALERIAADPRHHRIEILSDQAIESRAFSDWSMAYRDAGHPATLLEERTRQLVASAPAPIRDRFRRFIAA